MKKSHSQKYRKVAQKVFFQNSENMIMKSAKGAYIKDADDKSYLDFNNNGGAILHGHAHPYITKVVRKQIKKGVLTTPSKKEIELANRLVKRVKGIDRLEFFSSYTDAVMNAVRISRAVTEKKKILIFEECRHGHYDACMALPEDSVLTFSDAKSLPSVTGVLEESVSQTIVLPINNMEKLERAFEIYGKEFAAVLIEPLITSNGLLHLLDEFFVRLIELTRENNCILIRDEFRTSFRLSFPQDEFAFSEQKDLVIMGNTLSVGLPFAILGYGKYFSMQQPEQQSDSLTERKNIFDSNISTNNSIVTTIALAQLDLLQDSSFYKRMSTLSEFLQEKFDKVATDTQVSLLHQGSIFWLYIHPSFLNSENEKRMLVNKKDISPESENIYRFLYEQLLSKGILLPSHYLQPFYLNDSMSEEDIEFFIKVLVKAIKKIPTSIVNSDAEEK